MKKSKNPAKILIIILALILIVAALNFFQKDARNFFYSVAAPFQKFFWQIGDRAHGFLGAFINIQNTKEEAGELKLKNQELIYQLVQLEAVKKENEDLRQALDIGLQKDFKLLAAQITAKYIAQDYIIINQGENAGSKINMPVISAQKVLVGKVIEVYKDFSKVALISDKDISFDAKIRGKEISAIVNGQGNLSIFLDLIPRDKEVAQGDVILSSSTGGIFPDDLLVGTIKNIKKSDLEAFQQADLEPFFNIKETNTLFLIAGY